MNRNFSLFVGILVQFCQAGNPPDLCIDASTPASTTQAPHSPEPKDSASESRFTSKEASFSSSRAESQPLPASSEPSNSQESGYYDTESVSDSSKASFSSSGDGNAPLPASSAPPSSSASGSRSAPSEASSSSSGEENNNSKTCDCSIPSTLLQDPSTRATLVSEDTNSLAINADTSDIVRQLYDRYEAGDEIDQIELKTVPQAVQQQLDSFSLAFNELPGLIQRAVLWDSGFVVTADQVVQVWTFDNRSMAEISLSVDEFKATGCKTLSCTQENGELFQTYSSCNSSPTQVLAASKCVVEAFETTYNSNETLWSTGGNSSSVPEIRVDKNKGTTDCGCEFTVYSITTSSRPSSLTTSQCERSGSLVVPCYGNDNVPDELKSRITTPKGADWVKEWLKQYRNITAKGLSGSSTRGSSSASTESKEKENGGFSWEWLLFILLIPVLIVASIVAWRHCHRLSRFATPPDNTRYIFVGGRMWAVEEERQSRGAMYWLRFANWCRKTFKFFSSVS